MVRDIEEIGWLESNTEKGIILMQKELLKREYGRMGSFRDGFKIM